MMVWTGFFWRTETLGEEVEGKAGDMRKWGKSHQKRNRNNQCLIPENVTHLELQNAAIIRILSIQMFGTNAIDIGSIRESRKPQGCGYLDHCSRTGVLLGFLHARLRTVWDQNLLC